MASYSIGTKAVIQQVLKQPNTSILSNKQMDDIKIIKRVHTLLEKLSSNETQTFLAIFIQLNSILHELLDKDKYKPSFGFIVFDTILKRYIKLLDNDQFIDKICQNYSKENNDFFRNLFHLFSQYDIESIIKPMNTKTRRRTFCSLFDSINSSTRIRLYLQNNENMNLILINTCTFILYTILRVLQKIKINLTNNDLEKYDIFKLFVPFIDEYFSQQEHLRINEKRNESLIVELLGFIWNMTDHTLTIPIFVNANYPQACSRWLSLSYLHSHQYEYIINILNNIARHNQGILALKKFHCENILRQFKNEIFNQRMGLIIYQERRINLSQILDLLFVLIIEPEELYMNKIDRQTINQVLLFTKNALISSKVLYYEGHISEFLIPIMKLCANDNLLDYILQQDQCLMLFFTTLKTTLSTIENKSINNNDEDLHLDVLAIISLANILWSISFHNRYKNDLIQNINLVKKLEVFRESDKMNYMLPHIHIPHQMSTLKRSIDGIYQNLYPLVPSTIQTNSQNCSLMICYSHNNIDFCRQFYDVLRKLPELTIHIDIKNGKYLWKETARIIDESKFVLILISKDFFYSKSCRQEFNYITNTLKKLFFPIFIDQYFKATGWLHQQISRLKYIRFGEKDFMKTCEDLLSLINETISMNLSLHKNSLNISNWNDIKIKQWFTNNNIIPELYDFYHFHDGTELLSYARATLASPWTKEFERIKLRFKQQERTLSDEQFLQFINALKCL